MDIRIPGFLMAMGLLAFFTRRCETSGEMMLRTRTIKRTEYPRLFFIGLIMRWVFVVVFAALAGGLLMGWLH